MEPCDAVTEQGINLAAQPEDRDLILLRAVGRGEARALETLYAAYGPGLLNYLAGLLGQREVAEEALQEVMLAVWRGAGGFRGDSSVRTWLLAITRRQAMRRRRRVALCEVALDEAAVDEAPDVADALANRLRVRDALARLPDHQRGVLELVFFHELSEAEAALVLGVPAGTVKSRLSRAKAALKRLLSSEEVADG